MSWKIVAWNTTPAFAESDGERLIFNDGACKMIFDMGQYKKLLPVKVQQDERIFIGFKFLTSADVEDLAKYADQMVDIERTGFGSGGTMMVENKAFLAAVFKNPCKFRLEKAVDEDSILIIKQQVNSIASMVE